MKKIQMTLQIGSGNKIKLTAESDKELMKALMRLTKGEDLKSTDINSNGYVFLNNELVKQDDSIAFRDRIDLITTLNIE